MTEDRIITGVEVTTGEAPDGPELKKLIEQSSKNGIDVREVIGDTAYSGKDNLEYAEENEITLISRLNPVISNGNGQKQKGFEYNKDADMYQCPAGHLAEKKYYMNRGKCGKNVQLVYFYDTSKCQCCAMRDGCYDDTKQKT